MFEKFHRTKKGTEGGGSRLLARGMGWRFHKERGQMFSKSVY